MPYPYVGLPPASLLRTAQHVLGPGDRYSTMEDSRELQPTEVKAGPTGSVYFTCCGHLGPCLGLRSHDYVRSLLPRDFNSIPKFVGDKTLHCTFFSQEALKLQRCYTEGGALMPPVSR